MKYAKPPFAFRHCTVIEDSPFRLVFVGGEACTLASYGSYKDEHCVPAPTYHWHPFLGVLVYDKLEQTWSVQ